MKPYKREIIRKALFIIIWFYESSLIGFSLSSGGVFLLIFFGIPLFLYIINRSGSNRQLRYILNDYAYASKEKINLDNENKSINDEIYEIINTKIDLYKKLIKTEKYLFTQKIFHQLSCLFIIGFFDKKHKLLINDLKRKIIDINKEITELKYFLNQNSSEEFERLRQAYKKWLSSSKIWFDQNYIKNDIENNIDYSAIQSLIEPLIFRFNNKCLCLYPKIILLFNEKGYFLKALQPVEFNITTSWDTEAMTNNIPKDAQVIKQTWLHAKKDGSKDMRYSMNYPIYNVKIGIIIFNFINSKYSFRVSSYYNCLNLQRSFKQFTDPESIQKDNLIEYELPDNQLQNTYHSLPISPRIEKKNPYAVFKEMRHIGQNSFRNADQFINQAKFMVNFEDHYQNMIDFHTYYSCYMDMNDEQLRCYFTWRTNARKRIFFETSASYIFVYIYEIINNIGILNPKEGLDTLFYIWQECRKKNNYFDSYLYQWIVDYYIVNDFDISFKEAIEPYDLKKLYANLFIENDNALFENFQYINHNSDYNIMTSRYYSEETKTIIENCLKLVLKNMNNLFEQKQLDFKAIVEGTLITDTYWQPFQNALYVRLKSKDRTVILGKEVYSCKSGQWSSQRLANYNYVGGAITGYIIKRMEAKMRIITKFKHKLFPNRASLINRLGYFNLESSLISLISEPIFDDVIDQTVEDYFQSKYPQVYKNPHSIYEKPVNIEIDPSQFGRIRSDALAIQDKLIINIEDSTIEERPVQIPVEKSPDKGYSNVWEGMFNHLSNLQKEALKTISNEENINKSLTEIANKNGILTGVLIESINETALEFINDNLINASAEPPCIYEDYSENVKSLIRR